MSIRTRERTMADEGLRATALDMALRVSQDNETPEGVIKRAEVFYTFLSEGNSSAGR